MELILMTDAMEVLYAYAQDYLEPALLLGEPELKNVRYNMEKQEKRLRAALNQEALQCLENYLDEQKLLLFFEKQALFRAGFQIAMELSR